MTKHLIFEIDASHFGSLALGLVAGDCKAGPDGELSSLEIHWNVLIFWLKWNPWDMDLLAFVWAHS